VTKCSICNDTGVEDTGNNELPCVCPAGDTALFSVAGIKGPVPGGALKREYEMRSQRDAALAKVKALRAALLEACEMVDSRLYVCKRWRVLLDGEGK